MPLTLRTLSLNGIWKFRLNDGEEYRDIQIPSNWYLQGLNHSGKVYYQKKFKVSIQKDKDYCLIFKGVDYFCKVKLNGRLIGDHEGYFQEFSFMITNILKMVRIFSRLRWIHLASLLIFGLIRNI